MSYQNIPPKMSAISHNAPQKMSRIIHNIPQKIPDSIRDIPEKENLILFVIFLQGNISQYL